MVGGDRAAFERVEPLLDDIGPKVTYVGPNGAALVMKLAINLSLVVQVMSFCESVAVAEKHGIEREAAVDADPEERDRLARARLPRAVRDPGEPARGRVVGREAAAEGPAARARPGALGSARAVPFAALGDQFLTATRAAGHGDKEFAAAYEVFRSMGGIE